VSGRYQQGCLYREKRKHGDVWVLRFRDGQVNRKQIIGTVERYTKKEAMQLCEPIRAKINRATRSLRTVADLVAHYEAKELPRKKSYSTRTAYEIYLKNWIVPKWGECLLHNVETVDVEEWLDSTPLADGSKAKIRAVMSILFRHALRHNLYDKNPIAMVRQGSERENDPELLTSDEVANLLAELNGPYRVMALLAASTGFRVSEIIGLRWEDIDHTANLIRQKRGIVCMNVGPLKTKASKKPTEMTEILSAALLEWRGKCAYNQDSDYVFASIDKAGKQPLWPSSAMSKHIRPAAVRAGITKHVRWHLFRHWHGSTLGENGASVKVIQESLRHASSAISLDVYSQAGRASKQAAQCKLIQSIVPICSSNVAMGA